MTASEATQIVDLALEPRPLHHLSVDSPQDHQEGGDPCSKMRYHQRSYSIDSLAAVVWAAVVWAADLLVGFRSGEEKPAIY